MRIKKKDIILEATLLDASSEFNPQEKKLLQVLHKKFGVSDPMHNFDRWIAAGWLIEHFGVPHDVAFDMALTYWWHGDKLFKEYEPIRKMENRGYLFVRALQKIIAQFKEERGENFIGNFNIAWNDSKRLFDTNKESFVSNSPVVFWDGYNGFNLYITLEDKYYERYDLPYSARRNSTIIISVKFKEYTQGSSYKEEPAHPKTNTHVNVDVSATVGDGGGKIELPMDNFDINIPIPLTPESIENILLEVIEKVKSKVENMSFDMIYDED